MSFFIIHISVVCIRRVTFFFFFWSIEVLRYFYCTVHCVLLLSFTLSISHPTHVTSCQFLTNESLPKKCPSKERHLKSHLPSFKNRRKFGDIHQWFRREGDILSVTVRQANSQFLLMNCWLTYLAPNTALADKLMTTYEEEVTM
jgi:hypothetical protein